MHTTTLGRRRILDAAPPTSALTILHAPAGWGKSTLLRESHQSLHAAGKPSLWLTLEEGLSPSDVQRALADALDRLLGGDRTSTATLRTATTVTEVRSALGAHLTAHPDLTLHVDGVECMGEHAHWAWDVLVALATHHPLSRSLVSTQWLSDAERRRLRMTPGVTVLGQADLTFTPDDVEHLLSAATGQTPDRSLVAHVHTSTQGCPRAVVSGLVETAPGTELHRIDWRGANARATWEELDRLGVLPLVRTTGWLPRVDIALASTLSDLDHRAVERALTTLERSGHGAWSRAGDGSSTFTYAPSLRETLESARGTLPGTVWVHEEHSERAIDWLVERGEVGEALVLALRARHLTRATEMYRRMLVTQPNSFPDSFESVLRDIPPADLTAHPVLAVARGVTLLDSPATRGVAMRLLEPVADRNPSTLRRESPEDELMELTAQSVVLRLLGRTQDSARAALEAAQRIQDPAYANGVDTALFTPLVCQLSQSLFEAGDVATAQSLIALGGASASKEQMHHWGLYGRAWYGLDGRTPAAEEMATHIGVPAARAGTMVAGIAWGRRTQIIDDVGAGALLLDRWQFDAALERTPEIPGVRWGTSAVWTAWVRLHASLGRGTHATEVVRTQAALESARSRPTTLGHAALANVMTVAWLATGNVVRARRVHVSMTAYPGQTAPAALLLAASCAGPDNALNSLPQLREAAGHTVRSRAALETVGCALALRAGAVEYATHLLEEVAALHDQHGCRAHLLYLSEHDRDAVRQLAETLQSPAVDRLLEGLHHSAALPASPKPVALSRRELAVLRALASHPSRADVAAALHVSENTVKSQLRSVYRKLEVTTREEAVLRASELDLLGEQVAHV